MNMIIRPIYRKTLSSQAWEAGSIPVFRSQKKKSSKQCKTTINKALTEQPP